MFEHRFYENILHGASGFPFHVYHLLHSSDSQQILPIHWHNELEIIVMMSGQAIFRIENNEFPLAPGEALIVHPGELHSGVARNTPNNETIRYSAIVFKLSWISSIHSDRVQESYLSPILDNTTRLPVYLTAASETHATPLGYIRQIIAANERKEAGYEMSLKGLLYLLLADLHRLNLMEKGLHKRNRHNQESRTQIKQVLAYMETHFLKKIDLDELASVLSLSRSHFCRFFKAQTGMRPMEYLNYIRINHAANLLQSGSYNVLEAALESGFPHVSYFAKWFKAFKNMTPSDFKSNYSSGL